MTVDASAPRLYLHAGHGKTGSSYLQAWLALNAESLRREHGLAYPLRSPLSGEAERSGGQARFSMGNGFIFEELLGKRGSPRRDAPHVLSALRGDAPGLVFSRERFLRSLPPHLPAIEGLARTAGMETVEVLLFLRDPLEHAHSLYAEMVKAHGYADGPDRWLSEYDLLDRVEAFLADADRCRRTRLTLVSYSRSQGQILPPMCDWLRLPPSTTLPAPAGRANRSLTAAEVRVQRLANQLAGSAAATIGRRLAEELPDVTGPPAVASRPAQEAFLRRVREQVERLNRRLPSNLAYALEISPLTPDEPASLTAAQAEIVVEELERTGMPRGPKRSLSEWVVSRLGGLASRLGRRSHRHG